jgi:hypothetical protein
VIYEISMGKSQDQFPELPTRLRELPEAGGLMRLNTLVLRACEHQAAKRFRSAEELQAALAALRSQLTDPRPGTPAGGDAQWAAGSRVVILCPMEALADSALARLLGGRLAKEGFSVFLDEQPALGVEWARRIEQQLRSAHAVIPILSASSVHNEMMAYALEIAQQASRRPTRLPLIFQLSLQLQDPLPRQMALALIDAVVIRMADGESSSQAVEHATAAIRMGLSSHAGSGPGQVSGADISCDSTLRESLGQVQPKQQ